MFLGNCENLVSKYGDFKHFFPSNVVVILPFFPKRKSFVCPWCPEVLFSLQCKNFAQKKKHWGARKIEIICI
jgi:hypothetical protein